MTLKELFTQIADAIREKKGITEPIVAEDFPEEIESIESGGKFVLPEGTHLQFSSSTFSEFDLSNCDTSNVTSMNIMFGSCINLTDINLSSINTSNVTNMSGMFNGCSKLTSLDVSRFNTASVEYMGSMFNGCSILTTIIGIENFDLSNLPYTEQNMFQNCPSLSNETLNNILKALSTITYTTSRRTLKRQGFTQEQATICTTLSNWSLCKAQSWTTGY